VKECIGLAVLAASLLSCSSPPAIYGSRDDDAVPIYRGLNGRFPKLPKVVTAAFERARTDPAELDAAIAAYDALLEELATAARARRCQWTYDPLPTITAEYPIDYVLSAGRLLVVRSRRRFDAGAVRPALEDLLVLQRFSSDLLQDRWTIAKLLGVILGAWAGYEFEERLAKGRLDRAGLDLVRTHLAPLVRRFPPPEAFIRDERAMAIPLLEEIRDLGLDEVTRRVAKDTSEPAEVPPIVSQWHEWLRKTLQADIATAKRRIGLRWDHRMAPLLAAHGKPLNSGEIGREMADVKKGSRALSERLARRMLGAAPKEDDGLDDVADLIFMLWVPALEKASLRLAECRLLLETTLLGCSLELRRLNSGSYPDDLRGMGEIPRDPFVGGPIRYRRVVRPDGEGYVLAAAGPGDNAEERIRVYSEECGFDQERFEKKGFGDVDAYTFGVFRAR
jgi:hypothetical protein